MGLGCVMELSCKLELGRELGHGYMMGLRCTLGCGSVMDYICIGAWLPS